MLLVGVVLAALCAAATNLGFLLKHRGCCQAPPVSIRRPLRSAAALWRQRLFAAGMGVCAVGFALHVAALALAPMSVVQAVIAGGLVFLAVLAERAFGLSLGRRQWAGVLCTATGLTLLGLTLPGGHGDGAAYSLEGMLAFEGALIVCGALFVAGPRAGLPGEHHGVLLGAAAGIAFGVSDIAVKALTGAGSVAATLSSPWLLLIAGAAVAGFYTSARSFQKGEAVAVITVTALAANLSGIAGGFVVFGDPLPSQTLPLIGHVAALVLVIASAWLVPAPTRLDTQPA